MNQDGRRFEKEKRIRKQSAIPTNNKTEIKFILKNPDAHSTGYMKS
jgi:hypothetical protein